MSFYTNVVCIGNHILFRGVSSDGRRFKDRVEYKPPLYIPAKNNQGKFKTLDGQLMGEIRPGSIKECRDFIRKYSEVENFEIHGNNKFEFSFLAEHFPEEHIDYDFSQIRIAYLDIETGSEHGFPNIETANEQVTAITLKIGKKVYVFGTDEFVNDRDDVFYFRFESERAMLEKFFEIWDKESPDVLTGWNVESFDIPILSIVQNAFLMLSRIHIVCCLRGERSMSTRCTEWGVRNFKLTKSWVLKRLTIC